MVYIYKPMIKNKIILFDLHGVLLKYSFYELLKLFLNYKKKTHLILCFLNPKIMLKCIYLLTTENVIEKIAITLIKEFPKLNRHTEFILEGINKQVIKSESISILKRLKDNNKLYICSNIGEKSINILLKKYPQLFNNFNDIFYTKKSDNYLCKPSKKYFEKILSNFQNSNDIIFIDDNYKNLKTANEFNLTTIHFNSFKTLKKDLNI
jgi:FMN phosphatase YigB (HAD superfamily)